MFVEPNRLVIVTVEEAFVMKLRLINQARQMDVPSELLVGTARMQPALHGAIKWPGSVRPQEPRHQQGPAAPLPSSLPAEALPGSNLPGRWLVHRRKDRLYR